MPKVQQQHGGSEQLRERSATLLRFDSAGGAPQATVLHDASQGCARVSMDPSLDHGSWWSMEGLFTVCGSWLHCTLTTLYTHPPQLLHPCALADPSSTRHNGAQPLVSGPAAAGLHPCSMLRVHAVFAGVALHRSGGRQHKENSFPGTSCPR